MTTLTGRTTTHRAYRVMAPFPTHAEVQWAVDSLSDRRFPVEHIAIGAEGVRFVEQVTGRYGWGNAAADAHNQSTSLDAGVPAPALFLRSPLHRANRPSCRYNESFPIECPKRDGLMAEHDVRTAARPVGDPIDADPPLAPARPGRLPLEPMDPAMTSIQPGGGVVARFELAWGRLRRWYLKAFRRGYVARMALLRKGSESSCPHEVLDPRDVKFYRNQPGNYYWDGQDDPFAWRDRLPFARVGLAELLVFSVLFYGGTGLVAWTVLYFDLRGVAAWFGWANVTLLAILGVLVTWFFRNPLRIIPQEQGVVVSPADGKVAVIGEIEHDDYIGGPAVLIGIFLSIFNVHINRVPVATRVIGVRYKPGKFLNALRPESAQENAQVSVRIEQNEPPFRRMIVRQITGAFARRIVCWVKPGDELAAGEQFGMIKLGSRTELILPREEGLEIAVTVGESVQAGSTVLARYRGGLAN